MTTHRRYSFEHPGPQGGHDVLLRVLEHACEQRWWYKDPEVGGQHVGRLWFAFTVSARDQWWAHRRAMLLAQDAYWALGIAERDIPEPDWEPLPPHTNRGWLRRSATTKP